MLPLTLTYLLSYVLLGGTTRKVAKQKTFVKNKESERLFRFLIPNYAKRKLRRERNQPRIIMET